MGKNCIIMPIFAIGFTAVMRILYNNMDMGSSAPIEMLNAYVLSMGLVESWNDRNLLSMSAFSGRKREKYTPCPYDFFRQRAGVFSWEVFCLYSLLQQLLISF